MTAGVGMVYGTTGFTPGAARTIAYGYNDKPVNIQEGPTLMRMRYGPDEALVYQFTDFGGKNTSTDYFGSYELKETRSATFNTLRATPWNAGDWEKREHRHYIAGFGVFTITETKTNPTTPSVLDLDTINHPEGVVITFLCSELQKNIHYNYSSGGSGDRWVVFLCEIDENDDEKLSEYTSTRGGRSARWLNACGSAMKT